MKEPELIPVDEMARWTWTQLAASADRHTDPFHLLTMATVSPDGSPSARLMTNRGADPSTGRLWFYTRADTPKIADLRACGRVCLIGYDAAHGVQVRLSGVATLHRHGPLADRHWDHVARVSRWLYQLTPEEGADAVGIDPRLPHDREQLQHGLTTRARAQFGVLEIAVETIDWLQATGSRHCRAVMHARDDWRPVVTG